MYIGPDQDGICEYRHDGADVAEEAPHRNQELDKLAVCT